MALALVAATRTGYTGTVTRCIEISVLPDFERGIRVQVSGSGAPPVIVRREAIAVQEASAAVRVLTQARPGLVAPGQDAELVCREREAGVILGTLLFGEDLAGRRLRALLAEARGAARRVALLLDIRVPALRALPWELVGDPEGGPLESAGAAVVVRHLFIPGASALQPPEASPFLGWRIAFWCPDHDDPSCVSVLTHLAALATRLGLPAPVAVDQLRAGERFALHLICHGEGDAEALVLHVRDAALHPESVGHGLTGSLRDAWVVALAICDAAAPSDPMDGLPGLLLAAGAPLCVGPSAPLGVPAALAMAEGLYTALASGRALCESVLAARAAIRALASPHPHGRWTRLLAYAADAHVMERGAIGPEAWTPVCFPVGDIGARECLLRAAALARDRQDGFVGVEHLIVAISQLDLPASRLLRARLIGREAAIFRHVDSLGLGAPPGEELYVTARLQRVGAFLHANFSVEALLEAMHTEWDVGLSAVIGVDLPQKPEFASVETTRVTAPVPLLPGVRRPAEVLRLIGGPEDGRHVQLSRGQVLGRASARAPCDCTLYAGMTRVDTTLGRAHLRWEAPGRIWLSRPAMAFGQRSDLGEGSGEISLAVGDLLQLAAGTFILALASPEGDIQSSSSPSNMVGEALD